MDRLNGKYHFFYSKEQEKLIKESDPDQKKTYVNLMNPGENNVTEFYQYTEMVHEFNMGKANYTPHDERFDDSREVAVVEDPEIMRGESYDR